jgi:transposase
MKKIFIGIDFSKEKFDATLIKAEGLKECAPSMHEVFDNKTSGFRRLVRWVKTQSEGLPIDTWLFCGENTGAYSIGLSNYLYASGYDMCLECACVSWGRFFRYIKRTVPSDIMASILC